MRLDKIKLQKILHALPDMYFVLDSAGVILEFKPSLTTRPILPPEQFIGKLLGDVLPEHIASEVTEHIGKILDGATERRMSYTLPGGTEEDYFEVRFTRLDENEVLAVVQDVTGCRRADNNLRALINANTDMAILLDVDGKILAINARAASACGKKVDQAVGASYWDLLPPETAKIRKRRLAKVFRTGEASQVMDISDDLVFEVSAKPLAEADGRVTSVAFFIRDITAKVKSENDLIESEGRYRQLFEENPVPMYIYDMETLSILDVNMVMIEGYGYSRDEMVAMTIKDIRPPEDVEALLENVSDLSTGQVYLGQWRHLKKDGSIIDVEITSSDFPYKEYRARLVLCNDVTDRNRIRKQLEDSESKFRSIVESSPMGMHMYRLEDDDRLVFTGANPAADKLLGVDNHRFVGMTLEQAFPPLVDTEVPEKYREVCNAGESWHTEQIDYQDEQIRGAFEVHAFKTGYNTMTAMFLDITERKIAARALADSEAKFRQVFQTSPDAMAISRIDDGFLLDVNNGFLNLIGYSREEAIGKTTIDLGMWLDSGLRGQAVAELKGMGKFQNLEVEVKSRSGEVKMVLVSGTLISLANESVMLTIARDITDLKAAQKAMLESEERFRTIFQTSPDSLLLVNPEEQIIDDVNEGFIISSGYARDEVVGKSSLELDIWADPSDRDRFYEAISHTGTIEGFEFNFWRKDGSPGKGLLSAKIFHLQGEPRILLNVRDITDLMEIQDQLKDSLSEKEILLKEIHHRVKNNLQVISGLLNLQAHHITDPKIREVYKESQNRVITMALIHEELYQSQDLGQVHFGDYIRNLCQNLMVSYGADIREVKLEVETVKTEMVVDTAIPCGLIINELVTNSLKHAFPEGRTGTIDVAFHSLPDEMYELVVSDDGVGIPADVDIMKTPTLGMQLITVLVQQMGGTIEMSTEKGTSFTIQFREYHEAGTVLY